MNTLVDTITSGVAEAREAMAQAATEITRQRTRIDRLETLNRDLLALVKIYASECAECGGTGEEVVQHAQFGPQVTPCPDCADIRAVIANAERQS